MDIKFIKENSDIVRTNQKNRFKDPSLVDKILELDTKSIQNNFLTENCNRVRNIIIKQIQLMNKTNKELMQNGSDNFDPEIIFNECFNLLMNKNPNQVKSIIEMIASEGKGQDLIKLSKYVLMKIDETKIDYQSERDKLIGSLSNLLGENIPISDNEDNNTQLKSVNNSINRPELSLTNCGFIHVDLVKKLNIVDTETGTKLAGNRGYFLKGVGVKLNMALMMYALDFLDKRGFTLMYTPHFLKPEIMAELCQMEEYDETLYKLHDNPNPKDFKYMIATSEQPLTGYHIGHKFNNELDHGVKYAGISTCYRKETGKHGIDTTGIFRVHQFEKVEQLCYTQPNKSSEMHDAMLKNATDFLDSLGLDYRVITIVSGALNNSASKKYDIEGWFAGSKSYKELVSCSNCTDFFSRRLNIRNKHNEYVHILNSTLCANTRTLCCILEQYQEDTGVKVPIALQQYVGTDFITFK